MEDERFDGLGRTLRNLRVAAGMTQEELAERAGISSRTVSDVERGVRTVVYPDTARRLRAALSLTEKQGRGFDAIARGHLTPPAVGTVGLPAPPTQLLGRSTELDEITGLLGEHHVRLLTLTGPGGIGKTRLALEVARRIGGSFAGRVFFVSLGELKDPSLVAPELAKTIGVPQTGEILERLITKHLATRPALVVLDTFEHLLPAAPLVYSVMLSCPEATLLVTSRSALRLRGEHEFPVPPLALPSGGIDQPSDLARWPATALFVDRAQAVSPHLELDAPAATLIAEICRKLDGLPLAIELAAARVKHLPLAAVRDQLEHRLGLLVGGALDLPLRQRTMRDTLAWSHHLLSTREQTLFRRLSAFAGSWSLTAVEPTCGGADEVGDTLEGISRLVDQSLVTLDRDQAEARYEMLAVVRDYAAERLLDARENVQTSRRHALHYLQIAEEAEPHLVRRGHERWFARLDVERGNLRRAMGWVIDQDEIVLALRYTVALWRYWRQLGEFLEGRRWSERALAMAGEAPSSLRVKALWAAAALAFPQGDYARMEELASQGLELARDGDQPMDLRNALTIQGMVAMGQGRHADALDAFKNALEVCRPLGLSWELATSHLNLAMALLHAGEAARAEATLQRGLSLYRELGDEVFAARAINHIAHAALIQGDVARAETLARDSLASFAEQHERQGIADALETMAAVAGARANAERAAILRGAAAAIRETIAAGPAPFEAVITARFTEHVERLAGEELWHVSWVAGHALSRDAAVAYGLD